MSRALPLLLALLAALPAAGQNRFPAHYAPDRTYTGQRVEDLLAVPEERVDVGLWALVIAKEYDSSVDVEAYLHRLDEMVAEVRQMLAGRTNDMDKLLAVRAFLYEPGPWNDHRPFDYDLDDPLGERPGAQLLSTYLDTRLGNCVTMPTLFFALMERLDPDVPIRGVSAPLHLFLRLHDRQTGDTWNVETANRANPARNQWYVDEFDIPERGIESGAYLRDLTKREFLAQLASVLLHQARAEREWERALSWAEFMLALHPLSVQAHVGRGAVLEWIVYEEAEGGPPAEEHRPLLAASTASIERAQALGWVPETTEAREAYLQAVAAERERRAREN